MSDRNPMFAWPPVAAVPQPVTAAKTLPISKFRATTVMLALTDLAVTLRSGRAYSFEVRLFLADDEPADGLKVDLNGGTVSPSLLRAMADVSVAASTPGVSVEITATSDVVAIASTDGTHLITIRGTIIPDGDGTLVPRFAKVANTTGTATCYQESTISVTEIG